MRKLVWLAAATALAVLATGAVQAQQAETPRKGGTLRMTAPYAASFGSLDPHVTPRAQDDIVGKAINRTLYNWNTAANKLELELAKSVSVSADGLTYTYKLRDDAYFHNGRKMTADDLIFSFTRIMDGSKGYPGARYVRLIKGAVDVEKGQAKEISGLKKIDDFTLEMTITDRSTPATISSPARRRSCRRKRSRRATSPPTRSASAPSSSRSTSRVRASSWSASTSSTSPASPTSTSSRC